MPKLQRAQVLDLAAYELIRAQVRANIGDVQQPRRIQLGTQLVFMFENTTTVWFQVQEVLRAGRIADDAAIQHEIEAYNARLGDSGQLGCCVLVAIDDPTLRERRLREWLGLPAHVYLRCAGGATVRATFDRTQGDGRRVAAVQIVRFHVDDWKPIAVGCDLPGLVAEAALTEAQRDALQADLRASAALEGATSGVAPERHVAALLQDRRDSGRRRP
jgi:uncharacterized protein DUF3501